MPEVPSPPYLRIRYEGRRRTLLGEWQRSVMPFELHQGYAQLLTTATEYQCCYWLIDITRRLSPLGAADVSWLTEEYFPQLQPCLGNPVYLAYVMAPYQLAGMLAMPYTPQQPESPGLPYYFQRFTDEESARHWLKKCARKARASQMR
ncbi:hypothetical protein [Hymenobacter metallilatus]|uniref:STAS/SEC14 domain-containing protein n=1 Tax=Hymenobacter metallilatus TaxID=2493666 RepID=A0A3R9P6X6_9BACT|nr:hypothetical protein [Hymenobacter metallilatus]RSK29514.1 hypothetical protein EI290_16710 [Hymenobacter metallilatus]